MSSKKFGLLILFILPFLLGAAVSVKADTLYFNGVNGRVDVTGRAYISPYFGGLNKPGGMDNIYCIDPINDAYPHTHWNVNVTLLDTNTSLSNTYLGNSGRTQYKEVAWLFFETNYGTRSLSDQQAIQAAVWWIINPGNAYGRNNSWVPLAQAHYEEGNYSRVYILTDTSHQKQEFMINQPVTEVSTLFLLGTGMICIWAVRRWGRKS